MATLVCLYPYCTPLVMAQPNEPAGAAADPLAALTAALKLLLPNQPATTLKEPPVNGVCLANMMSSNYFESPQRACSIFRKYQVNIMTKVPTGSI